MPGVFQLIGDAWNFGRKQPALIHASFWLLLLPMFAMSLLSRFINQAENTADIGPASAASLSMVIFAVIFLWGIACVLVVGKRMVAAKAGRTRTSFKAVRREARGYIIPLILTSILRSVFAFLWSLLLIIPGIIYSVRTAFYFIIIVEEGVAYRAALQRSKDIARGHVWGIFWRLVVLVIILFAPISIGSAVLRSFSDTQAAEVGVDLLSTIFSAMSAVLFILCIIQLYGALRPATAPIMGSAGRGAKKKK